MTEPITSLPEAVAKNGAIPAPAGSDLTVDGLLAENALLQRKLASLKAEQDRCDAEYAEAIRERDQALETLAFQERNTLPFSVGHATPAEAVPALLASVKELHALRAQLIEALTTVYQSMTSCVGDEWAMEWLGEVWTQLPLEVRALAGDTDAAAELSAERGDPR